MRWIVLGLLVLAGLAISPAPLVQPISAPSAASVDRARAVLKQVAGGNTVAGTRLVISLSQDELDGLSVLLSQAIAPIRVKARLVQPDPPRSGSGSGTTSGIRSGSGARAAKPVMPAPQLVVQISRALPLGGWLNIDARAQSSDHGEGLPVIDMTIGHVPVPAWLTPVALRQAWLLLQDDTGPKPSLDATIPAVRIGQKKASIVIIHPGRSAAFAGLSRFGGIDPDRRWVAAAYCALTRHADTELAGVIRRAWRLSRPVRLAPPEQNRALMIAVAMRTIPEYRDRLAGDALPLISRCINPPGPILLLGRNDLAKHWSMSAALTASLGGQMAQSLGVWKELSDSLTGGSGFSFVDLAADRSGERFATAAMDGQLARFVQTRLAAVTGPQLVPAEALDNREGLDAAMFERIYHSIESPEYHTALAAIDRLLDEIGAPRP